jgi:hypothetical protein
MFPLVRANAKKGAIYKCIKVQHREEDAILDEEGELDNEAEQSDFEEMFHRKLEFLRDLRFPE